MSHLNPVPSGESSPEGAGTPAELADQSPGHLSGLLSGLLSRCARGDEQAFAELYDATKGSALSWLMTLAHRRAVDRVRAAEAASRQDTTYHQRTQLVPHDATAEAAESSLEARRVRSALAELSTVQREALELAYFGGYTHTEVATMLDLPVGTAKTRIRDGLIRLRDAMGVGQ